MFPELCCVGKIYLIINVNDELSLFKKDFDMEFDEVVRRRRSICVFSDRHVEPEVLRSLFEAARWAPSSMNEQPWGYIIGTKRDTPDDYRRIFELMVPFNQDWAQSAPVVGIGVTRTRFRDGGSRNRHAWHDLGLSTALLCLKAASLGLQVHPAGGFHRDKATEVLGLPEDVEAVTCFAIGYPGDVAQAAPHNRERDEEARKRDDVESFVFGGQWGKSAPLA